MLRPMFPYFGAKWSLAAYLGPPRFDSVVEAFAGSATYCLRWEPKQVLLIERDPLLCTLWRYLIRVSADEINRIPIDIDHVEQLLGWPEEVRWLVGFWFNRGVSSPRNQRSAWSRNNSGLFWGEDVRARICFQVDRIRHWQLLEGSYFDAPDKEAHWYVDPPYIATAKEYNYHQVDYSHLSVWCQTRSGYIQVSEAEGATWLPFCSFRSMEGTKGRYRKGKTAEVLWEAGW